MVFFSAQEQVFCPLQSGTQMQQYVTDQFLRTEAKNLSFLREHQGQLRASDYSRLRESAGGSERMEEQATIVRANKLFILPWTHINGERYMPQQMHDTIEISNKIRYLDFFLTLTINWNWPGIERTLLPEQSPQSRSDLAIRVCMINLQAVKP